ncbi:MAG: Ig-like domain-containing protein [Solirubrobacteraceae bacterium]
MPRIACLCALAFAGLFAAPALAAPAVTGSLTQLAGDAGCYTDDGFAINAGNTSGACTNVRGIQSAYGSAISPDGRFLYVASDTEGLLVFSIDTATGALAQAATPTGCYNDDGSTVGGDEGAIGCTDVRALGAPEDAEISGDGRFLYVYSESTQVAAFSRDLATGALTQLPGTAGCISNDGTATGDAGAVGCLDGRGFGGAYQLVLHPDGRALYAMGSSGRVVVLQRDAVSGAVSQAATTAGCLSNTGSAGAGDPGNLGCVDARAISSPVGMSLSPDGKFAYVASDGSAEIAAFSVAADGSLAQLDGPPGCLTSDGVATGDAGAVGCQDILSPGDYRILVSRDGRFVYSTNYSRDSIAVFSRDATTGALTQLPGLAACLSNDGGGYDNGGAVAGVCTDARALDGAYALIEGPEQTTLYVGGYEGREWSVLDLNTTTGALSQDATVRGCISETGTATGDPGMLGCADVRGVGTGTAAEISPGGRILYTVGAAHAVAAFERQVPPVCSGSSASTAFQTPVEVTLTCSDPNGDAVSITAGSASHGTVGPVSAGKATYTPAAGYSGADAFTFSASDGTNGSSAATAALTVGAAPPPVITPPVVKPPPAPALLSKTAKVDKKGRFVLRLRCAAGGAACRGVLKLRTATAVSAAKKKHVLALASKTYDVAAGKTVRVRLTLSAKGRTLLKRKRSVKTLATFAPAGGTKKTTRKLTLKRA